ncbi:hypothetical protein [Burkholderia orbicola]|uniref:hypothetical protein n=1 Tax=Burkholderia orbicola TaxID=2978683 RepID=UPI002FE06B72
MWQSTREGRAGAAIAAPYASRARIERAAAGLRIGDDGPASATRAGPCRPAARAAAPSLARQPFYHRPRALKWRATDTDYWCACRRCGATRAAPASIDRLSFAAAPAIGT